MLISALEYAVIAFGFLGLLTGAMLLFRMRFCTVPVDGCPDDSRLTIIVPARNEAQTIPDLLKSLAEQEGDAEVIVVDDHSDDGTADIAASFGARVVSSKPLPDGWTGKTWACYQGAASASHAVLLFLDADVVIAPGGLKKMLACFEREQAVVSVAPYHETKKVHEQFSAVFNIIVAASVNAFSLFSSHRSPDGLFGPCLMVKRTDYEKIGGHASVRDKILENFYMAEKFIEAKTALACFGGKSVLSYRMYPDSLMQLIEGWSKAFVSGAGHTDSRITVLISLWFAGLVTVPAYLAAVLVLPAHTAHPLILFLYVLHAIEHIWLLRRVGSFYLSTGVLYPVTVLFFLLVFSYSILKNKFGSGLTWKGRTLTS